MAKGGAPAVILKGQADRLTEIEEAMKSLAAYNVELGTWMQMMNSLFEDLVYRIAKLEEAVLGADYGDVFAVPPGSDVVRESEEASGS